MEKHEGDLEFIGEGVEACWYNAVELMSAARLVQGHGNHGLALALAVLAMEEIGKLALVDGLLFSKPEDERSSGFKNGFRSHKLKLQMIDGFPMLLTYLARFDPRFQAGLKFKYAIAIVIKQYEKDRNNLAPWIGEACNLAELNAWKQNGFYSHYDLSGRFVRPSEIDMGFTSAVVNLGFRVVDGVDFILKTSMDKYKAGIRAMRESITEDDLRLIRDHAQLILSEVFGPQDSE